MPFEIRVEQEHVKQFKNYAMLAAQQFESRLRPLCRIEQCVGEESRAVEIYGKVKATRQTERLPSNPDNPVFVSARWLKFKPTIQSGEYLPTERKWKSAMDPTSDLQRVHNAAIQRAIDAEILNAALGPAIEGKTGAQVAVNLGTAQTIDVGVGGANSNLNLDKLIDVREVLGLAEVDPMAKEKPTAIMTWKQMGSLLGLQQMQSRDFTADLALEAGIISAKVGINFLLLSAEIWDEEEVPNTLFADKANNVRYIPVLMPNAVVLGVWQDVMADMWPDSSRQNTPVIAIKANMSAVRAQETHVVRIACKE